MAGVRDIVQLKLQKKLLEEQLKNTDNKLDRLGNLLERKIANNPRIVNPEDNTVTAVGRTVSEFRIPPNKIKAQPKDDSYDCFRTQPSAITNPRILSIRQQFLIHTNGRYEVQRKLENKRLEELRNQKKEKKVPKIKIPESMLPNRYLRGELPCTIEHGGANGKYLSWACPLENLDYEYYLPLFFDGLQCNDKIVSFIARQGIEDMLYASKGHPERVLPVIALLARPLRNALSKFDTEILLGVLKALEQLITCNQGVGEKLLPFGRQFLTPIAFFLDQNKNIGDRIDYGQRRGDDVGEEVRKVLELMEEHGGPKALQYIKFSIPLYESCMKRPDAHHLKKDEAAGTTAHGTTLGHTGTRGTSPPRK